MCAHTCPVVNSQPHTPCLSLSLTHSLTLFPSLTLVSQHTGSMTYMHTACTICVTPMICLSHTQVYLCFVRLYTLIPGSSQSIRSNSSEEDKSDRIVCVLEGNITLLLANSIALFYNTTTTFHDRSPCQTAHRERKSTKGYLSSQRPS